MTCALLQKMRRASAAAERKAKRTTAVSTAAPSSGLASQPLTTVEAAEGGAEALQAGAAAVHKPPRDKRRPAQPRKHRRTAEKNDSGAAIEDEPYSKPAVETGKPEDGLAAAADEGVLPTTSVAGRADTAADESLKAPERKRRRRADPAGVQP